MTDSIKVADGFAKVGDTVFHVRRMGTSSTGEAEYGIHERLLTEMPDTSHHTRSIFEKRTFLDKRKANMYLKLSNQSFKIEGKISLRGVTNGTY